MINPNAAQVSPYYGVASIETTRINPAGLKIVNVSVDAHIRHTQLDHYNFVIDRYNEDGNRIGSTSLEKVPTFTCFNCTGNGAVLIIAICLLPGTGIIALIIGLVTIINYIRAYTIVKRNREMVPNLFKNMVYIQNLQSVNEYYEITNINEIVRLQAFAAVTEDFSMLFARISSELQNGASVRVMAYSNEFFQYEQNALKATCCHIYGSLNYIVCSILALLIWLVILISVLNNI